MPVLRAEKKKNFTVMSNHHLTNRRLSLKAKGLFSLMLSLPDLWDYSIKGLSCICLEGTDAIRAALRELEREHYIERVQKRSGGRFSDVEYNIYEVPKGTEGVDKTVDNSRSKKSAPQSEKPIYENPTTDNTTSENPTQ